MIYLVSPYHLLIFTSFLVLWSAQEKDKGRKAIRCSLQAHIVYPMLFSKSFALSARWAEAWIGHLSSKYYWGLDLDKLYYFLWGMLRYMQHFRLTFECLREEIADLYRISITINQKVMFGCFLKKIYSHHLISQYSWGRVLA